jgi:hypothetical protein
MNSITGPSVFTSSETNVAVAQGFTNPWSQIAVVSNFCSIAFSIFGSSVLSIFHVHILVARILRWFI